MQYARLEVEIADVVRFGAGCSSSGGSSPASASASGTPSDSDGSTTTSTDEYCPDDPREFRRHVSFFSPYDELELSSFRSTSPSSSRVLADVDKHLQRMVLLLPAFSSTSPVSAAARAAALSHWLAGFDVGWVLEMEMDRADNRGSLPRREVGRRVRVWVQALSTMDRVFRRRHKEVRNPVNDAAAAQMSALAELAAGSAVAMLKMAGAVVALGSAPSKLLAALDMYDPVSEVFPGFARMFSWGPSHPVSVASDAALAGLVDASQRGVRELRPAMRAQYYPWAMPQGGEVHPCVGFWMGYLRCMLRNRVSLFFILADDQPAPEPEASHNEPGTPFAPATGEGGLVAELISCLEAVLEEKSGALAFPGLTQLFMLNNTCAVVRRAVRSDLTMFLPRGWVRARQERMEGYVKGYLEASWAPVVARLGGSGGGAMNVVLRRRMSPLSTFYSAVENACSMQRCWKVPSPVLRSVLRRTTVEFVVPAYRRYLEDHPKVEVPAGRTAEELDHQLSELFEG